MASHAWLGRTIDGQATAYSLRLAVLGSCSLLRLMPGVRQALQA